MGIRSHRNTEHDAYINNKRENELFINAARRYLCISYERSTFERYL